MWLLILVDHFKYRKYEDIVCHSLKLLDVCIFEVHHICEDENRYCNAIEIDNTSQSTKVHVGNVTSAAQWMSCSYGKSVSIPKVDRNSASTSGTN